MVSWRALTVRAVQLSCRGYQPRGVFQGPALESCVEEVGVTDGGGREEAILGVRRGLAGAGAEVRCVYVEVCAFLGRCGWSGWCRIVSWA